MATHLSIILRILAVFLWVQSVHASTQVPISSVAGKFGSDESESEYVLSENEGSTKLPDLFEELPPICVLSERDSLEYCVFTSTRFAGGRGISILARRDHAEALLSLPAFTSPGVHSALGVNRASDPPFYAAEIPGRGIGLIANRTIKRGERLMSFTPAFMITEEAHEELSERERLYFQRLAFERLPEGIREVSYQLYGQNGGENVDWIDDILDTNTFGLPVDIPPSKPDHEDLKGEQPGHDDDKEDYEEGSDIDFKFLFPEIARFNHACRPTGDYIFDSSVLVQHIIAHREVMAGEELTITYIPPLQKRRARQKALQRSWGFTCDCSACAADAEAIRESDARVETIRDIQEELDDRSSYSEGSPVLAERMIELFKEDGLWTLMRGGYAAAAVEYSGVGDELNTQKYAALALQGAVVCEAAYAQDPEYNEMLQLRDNPQEHGSWRFRLPQGDKD